MPNHCGNFLTVMGEKQELSKFMKQITNPEGSENKISIYKNLYPCPQELYEVPANHTERPEMVEKYGASDWYDWCNSHWGTKWGDYDTYVSHYEEGDDIAHINYTTAWGPGADGLIYISGLFPNLVFINSYEEGGMGFCGTFSCSSGVLLADVETQYPEPTKLEDGEYDWDKQSDDVREAMDRCENEVVGKLHESYRKIFGAKV